MNLNITNVCFGNKYAENVTKQKEVVLFFKIHKNLFAGKSSSKIFLVLSIINE